MLAGIRRSAHPLGVTGLSAVLAALLAVWPAAVRAQTVSVAFRANVVPSQPELQVALGATVTLEMTRRLAVTGDLDYYNHASWATTIAATGAVSFAVGAGGWSAAAVPYVFAGGGYHRLSADLGSSHVLGPVGSQAQAGQVFCPAPGKGPAEGPGPGFGQGPCATGPGVGSWGVNELPDFYARRLGALVVPANREWPSHTWNDPVATAGAGVRLVSAGGFLVQPEARVWIVVAGGRTRTSGLIGASIGYRF
jgi:hypothetical protein